jgi:hypothetical protein
MIRFKWILLVKKILFLKLDWKSNQITFFIKQLKWLKLDAFDFDVICIKSNFEKLNWISSFESGLDSFFCGSWSMFGWNVLRIWFYICDLIEFNFCWGKKKIKKKKISRIELNFFFESGSKLFFHSSWSGLDGKWLEFDFIFAVIWLIWLNWIFVGKKNFEN